MFVTYTTVVSSLLSNGIKSAGEIDLISIPPWLTNYILRIPTEREALSWAFARVRHRSRYACQADRLFATVRQ